MRKRVLFIALLVCTLIAFLYLAAALPAGAASGSQEEPSDQDLSVADEVCLSCHGQPGQTIQLQDGAAWDLYVPEAAYRGSVHGRSGYACVQCHREVGDYPHPPFQAADLRDAQLKLNETCKFCHTQQYELANDSVHSSALARGTREAAVCVDCHSAHEVRRLNDPSTHELLPDARVWIPQTCARCHSAIFEKYRDSVHGSALIGEGNPDVPTCIDCHGVHNIEDPTTASFRLSSPQMCGKCHTDSTVVGKYGLSTDVLDTYVADFHGTTVTLFERQHPEEQTNKPVCYDCHGIHDIARADDPQKGLAVRQNLLNRCQECHPNASENFPDSWLSHYIPSPEKHPLVYYVDLFYKFFIPGVLGSMGILVAMDFSRKGINWTRGFMKKRAIKSIKPAEGAGVIPEAGELAPDPEQTSQDLSSQGEFEPTINQKVSPDTDSSSVPTEEQAEDDVDPSGNDQYDE